MIPSLFLAHGSPMIAVEYNEYTRYLNRLGKSMSPKAIVVFTAHWVTEELTVSSSDEVYDTIYDFYGFPRELYEIKYRAKGSSLIASRIVEKLKENGIPSKKDINRGLDHGAWTILKHLYPDANIPIVQVSVNPDLPLKDQFKIGKVIDFLGEEDILVVGSGNTVHNLGLVKWEQHAADPWAVKFDDWLIQKIKAEDYTSLLNYKELAPYANLATPTLEHFVPLFICMGNGRKITPEVIFRSYALGNLSYLCFEF